MSPPADHGVNEGDLAPRLFMSVDIVRSKQVKLHLSASGKSWLPLFRDLFERFPLVLIGKMALRFQDRGAVPRFAVWKALGDEIVFTAETAKSRERALLVAAFHDAVLQFDDRHRALGGYGVKGCCWEVPLDGRNEVITIPEMGGSGGADHLDIIGPDMDLGFVLAKSAQAGQTVLSSGIAQRMERFRADTGLGPVPHASLDGGLGHDGEADRPAVETFRLMATDR